MLWIACFLMGLVLTSVNVVLLLLASLFDATILFLPLFFLWWLLHHRAAGIMLATLLVFAFAIFVYQSPGWFTQHSIANEAFEREASVMTSIGDIIVSPPNGAPVPVNRPSSPYAVMTIYSMYKANPALAATQYSGKFAYVSGVVANLELDSDGHYESCVNMASSSGMNLAYGCSSMPYPNEFVRWTWVNQTAASKVPTYSSFVAECTIAGLDPRGTLQFSGCSIV